MDGLVDVWLNELHINVYVYTLGGQKYYNISKANKWRMTPINFVVA